MLSRRKLLAGASALAATALTPIKEQPLAFDVETDLVFDPHDLMRQVQQMCGLADIDFDHIPNTATTVRQMLWDERARKLTIRDVPEREFFNFHQEPTNG